MDKTPTVKFFLRNGSIVDWKVPAEQAEVFNFVGLCKAIRADGHFMGADLYIPHDHIAVIALEALPVTLPSGKPAQKPN
jgi:hypothetical protein